MNFLSRYPHRTDLDRRAFVHLAAATGISWLTPLSQLLARQAEGQRGREPAQSVILLWLGGGPSQLETFDPHPGTDIAAGTQAIATAVKDIQLADGFGRLAEEMASVSLVRSLVSKEGDHERGTYLMKTGYRPEAAVTHPSIGAVCCHELPVGKTEIPRHVSILPAQWPARGGYLGEEYNAFLVHDPSGRVPDVLRRVPAERDARRAADAEVVERAFARGRGARVESTLHRTTMERARVMMASEQLKAFELAEEPARRREAYGDTPFGRACLVARRLIEVGVRCVEVTLDGWDSHVNNHGIHQKQVAILDPAFSALIRDLHECDLFRKTVVVCMGEFGRTPKVNAVGGRDHWPNNFSLAIAGGAIRGGQVVGVSDPEGREAAPSDPVTIADVHATVLRAVGIPLDRVYTPPIGRPIKITEGRPIQALLG